MGDTVDTIVATLERRVEDGTAEPFGKASYRLRPEARIRRILKILGRRLFANALREDAVDQAQRGPDSDPHREVARRLFIAEIFQTAMAVERGRHDDWVFGGRV